MLGTSTSSIGATEAAYRTLDADGRFPAEMRLPRLHTPHSLVLFVQEALFETSGFDVAPSGREVRGPAPERQVEARRL